MFFLLFGRGNRKTKDFGSTIIQTCSICEKQNYFNLVRMMDWFDLFFIPIIPYNTEHHLVCPHCQSAIELEDEEQIEILKEMAGVLFKFNEEEINKKEAENEYEELVKKLGR